MVWSAFMVNWVNGGGCDANECAVDVEFERVNAGCGLGDDRSGGARAPVWI